ncbi:MAG: Gfo/Idh/MocA family protein [Actinomycetota bacterium]
MGPTPETSGEPVRLGIAGLGTVAQIIYLPLLARRPAQFRIAAVADASATVLDAMADRLHLPAAARHRSIDDLLGAGDLDAVLLLTSGSHGPAARSILAARLPLLCEKPLAYTVEEADALGPAARLQLGYMKQFDPAVERAGGLIDALGKLRSAEITVLHPSIERQIAHLGPLVRPAPDELLPSDNDIVSRALGSAAATLGPLYAHVLLGSIVHELSVLDALVGGLAGVDEARTWPPLEWPPSVALEGPLGDGARASIRWHFLPERPVYREEVALHFDDGSLKIVFPSPFWMDAATVLTVTERDGELGERVTSHRSPQEAFDRQLLAFHELVKFGGRPRAGVGAGTRHIALAQRAAALIGRNQGVAVGGEAAAR